MWFAILQYTQENPDAFLFSQVVINSTLPPPDDRNLLDAMLREGLQIVEQAKVDGSIRRGNLQAVHTVLVAPRPGTGPRRCPCRRKIQLMLASHRGLV